jgi:hypothetical protein
MAKILQLIDNTPQKSHNPSQQPRNPPQQVYVSLHITATLLGLLLLCWRSGLQANTCSCNSLYSYPDVDGVSHTTDRQYTLLV